jgi:outer membrane protein assembly factor BamB
MNVNKAAAILPAIMLMFVCGNSIAADTTNWPQFRGEGARGVSENANLPEKWSATENVAWKTEIPGQGWSSPIVWGDKVFLTTAITAGEVEEPKKGLYLKGERPDAPQTAYQWVVYALDLQTGKTLWERKVHEVPPPFGKHVKNTYASETPVTDGEHVYMVLGNIGIWCLDFDGNVVWNKPIEQHKMGSTWGTAASPVL